MTAPNVVAQFIELFRGRGDVVGSWDGGCLKQPLTEQSFHGHLNEGPFIGVYPAFNVDGVSHCVWGCTDIDHTDDPARALNLQHTFSVVGVPSWVERTAHGYHIWVFCNALVPAADMRNMFLAAHQVANEPPIEVNPKQATLAPGQVGNYVRCPYPGALSSSNEPPRRFMIDNLAVMMCLEDFVREAHATRIDPQTVSKFAAYYIPPPAPVWVAMTPTADMEAAAKALTPLGKVIWRDGPLVGNDRSTTMQHLAHEARKAGIAPGDCLLLLRDADTRWGRNKYTSRADGGEKEFLGLLSRAYGATGLTPSS